MLAFTPQGRNIRSAACSTQQRTKTLALILVLELAVIALGCASLSSSDSASSPTRQRISVGANLAPASLGSAYNSRISVAGGTAPYHFSITAGTLAPGVALNASNGSISGTPQAEGTFQFAVLVTDQTGNARGNQVLALVVGPGSQASSVEVTVAPAAITMTSASTQRFMASVTNTGNPAVQWSASAGTITSSGAFTAPQVQTPTPVTVTATSVADPSRFAVALVDVIPAKTASLTIASGTLPGATEGSAYGASLSASGGVAPYSWSVGGGALPSGVQLANDGSVAGTPQTTGSFPFTAMVHDSTGNSVSAKLTLTVSSSTPTGATDGPAELPLVYMQTALADTPAPGTSHLVANATDFKNALASANCGDTILLQAGATFDGQFSFPPKPCDDNHWIIVRTSSPDNVLPAEGIRLTPCYAGVSSLPGRPPLNCSSTKPVTAQMVFSGVGAGPILLANGANHYRFIGLEITRDTPGAIVYELAVNQPGGASDHIIYDRMWMHGTAQDETNRGVMLSGGTYVAVIDSYFSDFHCIAISGACGDAQAIAGGLGDLPQGPYKIVDNFLEASGENIILGGGPATQTPADIEIRRNHFYKPLIWMKGQPGFVGGRDGNPFVVKNHFELKNGIRVLFEGNVLENTWGGFSQSGFSVLLTPKNQNGHCPLCVVHDVTIRYSTISHAGNGIAITNGRSDSGAVSEGGWNFSLHDLFITDIDGPAYKGDGHLLLESNGSPVSALHEVSFGHVTGLGNNPRALMLVIGNGVSYPVMSNFTWSNNILTANGGAATTGGGSANCANNRKGYPLDPLDAIKQCFNPYSFTHNVLMDAQGTWPAGNYLTSATARVFVGGSPTSLNSYVVDPNSPYKGAASDGTDPGANISALAAAIAGVQ